MEEIFIIYNIKTGFINGGTGKINRTIDATHFDGSTITERIPDILKKNKDRAVIFLPTQKLPDPYRHKIKDGKIVDMDIAEIESVALAEMSSLEKRVENLEVAVKVIP